MDDVFGGDGLDADETGLPVEQIEGGDGKIMLASTRSARRMYNSPNTGLAHARFVLRELVLNSFA
jgi:hypothetical protein